MTEQISKIKITELVKQIMEILQQNGFDIDSVEFQVYETSADLKMSLTTREKIIVDAQEFKEFKEKLEDIYGKFIVMTEYIKSAYEKPKFYRKDYTNNKK